MDGLSGFLEDLAWTGRWALFGLLAATAFAAGLLGLIVGLFWGDCP